MDWVLIYVVTIYSVMVPITAWGAFSQQFDANILQRCALGLFALWAVWRIDLILSFGYGWPHEPAVVTALAIYAAGTVQKALQYRRAGQCRE